MDVAGDTPESLEPPEDRLDAVLASAARGEPGAWRVLVARYGRRVFALARSRLGSDDAAEEIAQAVFASLVSTLRRGGYAERGRFESWLFRVTMNRVRDEVRRRRRRGDPAPGAHELIPDAKAVIPDDGLAEDLARLTRAVQSLGERDREVIELRHHAGLPFAGIAEILGEPVGTVLARHHRALGKLGEMMGRGPKGAGGATQDPVD
jgi:RNA polymerase sigma-70 factor (ECF subfamily)